MDHETIDASLLLSPAKQGYSIANQYAKRCPMIPKGSTLSNFDVLRFDEMTISTCGYLTLFTTNLKTYLEPARLWCVMVSSHVLEPDIAEMEPDIAETEPDIAEIHALSTAPQKKSNDIMRRESLFKKKLPSLHVPFQNQTLQKYFLSCPILFKTRHNGLKNLWVKGSGICSYQHVDTSHSLLLPRASF